MIRTFTASITHEGDWFVAQCLEVDVASQGETEEDALQNLGEAIALHFTPPLATPLPDLRSVEVDLCGASAAALSRGQASPSQVLRDPSPETRDRSRATVSSGDLA